MATNKKSAVIYCDLITTVEKMKDVDAGKLFKHFLRYINDQNPKAPNQIVEIVFEPIKQQLKRDLKKWENKSSKNSDSAKLRWEKMRTDANALISKKNNANYADTVTVTVNDNVTVNVTDTKKSELIEIFFNDLPNCSYIETIVRNTKLTKDQVLDYIPAFRLKADVAYPSFDRFVNHFKNFINLEKNGTGRISGHSGNTSKVDMALSVDEIQNEQLKRKYGKL